MINETLLNLALARWMQEPITEEEDLAIAGQTRDSFGESGRGKMMRNRYYCDLTYTENHESIHRVLNRLNEDQKFIYGAQLKGIFREENIKVSFPLETAILFATPLQKSVAVGRVLNLEGAK